MTTADTPRTDACPHCGAGIYAPLGNGDGTTYWLCGSELVVEWGVSRSADCYEKELAISLENQVKAQAEVARLQANLRRAVEIAECGLMTTLSDELKRYFPKGLSIPRKAHLCRLCGQTIQAKEPCLIWSNVEAGEGWHTLHAHPECYQVTLDEKWDELEWESTFPGDIERPAINPEKK